MYHVHAHQQRYAQAAVLDGPPLQVENLGGAFYIEHAADEAAADEVGGIIVGGSAGDDVAVCGEIELADFLVESHLGHQLCEIHVLVGVGGGLFPLPAECAQRAGSDAGLGDFHGAYVALGVKFHAVDGDLAVIAVFVARGVHVVYDVILVGAGDVDYRVMAGAGAELAVGLEDAAF